MSTIFRYLRYSFVLVRTQRKRSCKTPDSSGAQTDSPASVPFYHVYGFRLLTPSPVLLGSMMEGVL